MTAPHHDLDRDDRKLSPHAGAPGTTALPCRSSFPSGRRRTPSRAPPSPRTPSAAARKSSAAAPISRASSASVGPQRLRLAARQESRGEALHRPGRGGEGPVVAGERGGRQEPRRHVGDGVLAAGEGDRRADTQELQRLLGGEERVRLGVEDDGRVGSAVEEAREAVGVDGAQAQPPRPLAVGVAVGGMRATPGRRSSCVAARRGATGTTISPRRWRPNSSRARNSSSFDMAAEATMRSVRAAPRSSASARIASPHETSRSWPADPVLRVRVRLVVERLGEETAVVAQPGRVDGRVLARREAVHGPLVVVDPQVAPDRAAGADRRRRAELPRALAEAELARRQGAHRAHVGGAGGERVVERLARRTCRCTRGCRATCRSAHRSRRSPA